MEKIIHEGKVYQIDLPLTPPTGKGEQYLVCPICTPTRQGKHQKEKKLAVNLKKTPMPWRCNHCGAHGAVIDEEYLQRAKIKPIFDVPRSLKISDAIVKWFWEKRRLNITTLEHFKIRMSEESVLQMKSDNEELLHKYINRKCVNFPYYKNDMLVNIKFRDPDKNFKMIKGATKIMYNLDSIAGQKIVVITEGEPDAMAYHQSGITSVVSVPNGATITPSERKHFEKHGVVDIQSNINLEYLDNCIDDFKNLDTIYIATDADAAGVKLREELARRLGKERCHWIRFDKYDAEDGEKCKDANDVLIHHGEKTLAASIHGAVQYPIEGVYAADAFVDEMMIEFDDGRKKGLSTGYKTLDAHFNWMRGWLSIMNGYPGEGKSSWLFNLVCITTVLYKWKWGLYCPENYPPKNIVDTMAEILVGNTADLDFKNRMSRSDYEAAIRQHLGKYIFFLNNEDGFTPNQLREKKSQMIRQHGIVGFLTDPWKNLVHITKGFQDNISYLAYELGAEVRFSSKHNLVNVIAHHPPNPVVDKNKEVKAPSKFNLTGGAIWNQTAYQIGCVHRHNREDTSNTLSEYHQQKVKENKLAGIETGTHSPVLLRFDRRTNRFYENNDPEDKDSPMETYPIKDLFDAQEKIDYEF